MDFSKTIQEKIDKQMQDLYRSMGVSLENLSTSKSSTYSIINNSAVSYEDLKKAFELVRPEHAILLCDYIEDSNIFEIDNLLPDKYYCKKLLLVNKLYYYKKLKFILQNGNINIKVYE